MSESDKQSAINLSTIVANTPHQRWPSIAAAKARPRHFFLSAVLVLAVEKRKTPESWQGRPGSRKVFGSQRKTRLF
jgi:hypothetical protein